jgi:hypothetical protein
MYTSLTNGDDKDNDKRQSNNSSIISTSSSPIAITPLITRVAVNSDTTSTSSSPIFSATIATSPSLSSPYGAEFREVKRGSRRQGTRTNMINGSTTAIGGKGGDARHTSQSIAMKIAGRHDSDIDFTWSVFLWQWFYHQWYPFTLPIYLWHEGYVIVILSISSIIVCCSEWSND